MNMMSPTQVWCELLRIPLPRTPVNKVLIPPSVLYIEPWVTSSLLRVESNVTRKGGRADERASPKGKAQKYPTVGTRALLQQRAYVRGPRLLRRRGHLLRAQGQGQRHSALHLRDDRGPEDSRGRRVRRLAGGGVERAQLRRTPLLLGRWVNRGMTKGRSPKAPALRPHDGFINAMLLGGAPAEERFRAAASCPCCRSYSTPPRSCPQQSGR